MLRSASVYAVALAVAMYLSACGGSDDPPPSDPEQIVSVVNSFWAAVVEGNGEAACPLLTDQGQRIVRALAQAQPDDDLELAPDCVAGVAGFSERLPKLEARSDDRFDPPWEQEFHVDHVDLTRRGEEARVECRPYNSIPMRRIGEQWRVDIPACTD